MGSDLFRARVLERSSGHRFPVTLDPDEMLAQLLGDVMVECFDVSGSPGDPVGALRAAFGAAAAECSGLEEAAALLGRTIFYAPGRVAAFRSDPASLDADDLSQLNSDWIAHNLLAERFPRQVEALEADRVVVEVAQMHPDAYVPRASTSMGFPHAFAARVLAEAHGDMLDNPIAHALARFKPNGIITIDAHADAAFDAFSGIVWACDARERVTMRLGDPAFWAEHDDQWWAHDRWIRPYLEQDLDENPPGDETWEVVRVAAMVHPMWLGDLVEGTFDSRAW